MGESAHFPRLLSADNSELASVAQEPGRAATRSKKPAVVGTSSKLSTTSHGTTRSRHKRDCQPFLLPIWARKPLRVVEPSAISIKFPFSVFFSKAGARNTSLSGRAAGTRTRRGRGLKERLSGDEVSLWWRVRKLKRCAMSVTKCLNYVLNQVINNSSIARVLP